MISIVLFLVVGLALGVGAERLVGGRHDAAGAVPVGAVPGASAPKRPRSVGRIVRRTAIGLVVLLLALGVGGYLWASSIFNKIEKIDPAGQLSHGSGTNYLLVGSDNGRTAADQRPGVAGARSDTIMVLRIQGGHAKMLSLNRDLWVTNPATGQKGRLNATYNSGPANLIKAVTQNFGIPIDRYIEIDFASFGSLVDSFGGIDITFANPAFDLASGLDVRTAGVVHLDGTQALAYVRSRHYYERINGQPVAEGGLPDVNRTLRQQTFLRAIMAKAGNKRNPFTLMSAASKMSKGLRIDKQMTMLDAARFAWNMGRLNPETVRMPVTPFVTSGGADVLSLQQPAADQILAQFR